MSQRRVVVTGLGATTPLGSDVATTWKALLAGQSGVRLLTEDWRELLPVHFAARVATEPADQMERVEMRLSLNSFSFVTEFSGIEYPNARNSPSCGVTTMICLAVR